MTPEDAVVECDRLLRAIDLAINIHPRIPPGRHERRYPPPQGFEVIYSRLMSIYGDTAETGNKEFSAFWEPVNAFAGSGLPSYYTTIQRPMSLRTILDDIANGKYASEADVRASVELIAENSVKFNGPTSEYTACAQKMLMRLDDEMRIASSEALARFQEMVGASDEATMQRAFHTIKTEAPHLVSGDDMVDLDNMHAGLVEQVIAMMQRES